MLQVYSFVHERCTCYRCILFFTKGAHVTGVFFFHKRCACYRCFLFSTKGARETNSLYSFEQSLGLYIGTLHKEVWQAIAHRPPHYLVILPAMILLGGPFLAHVVISKLVLKQPELEKL